jgi:hypothetical protein
VIEYDVNVPVPERCWCGALLVVIEEFQIDEADLEEQVAAGLDRDLVYAAIGVGPWVMLGCSNDYRTAHRRSLEARRDERRDVRLGGGSSAVTGEARRVVRQALCLSRGGSDGGAGHGQEVAAKCGVSRIPDTCRHLAERCGLRRAVAN